MPNINTLTQRPGVYSDVEASGVRYVSGKGRVCGLVCQCEAVDSGMYALTTPSAAAALFGVAENAAKLCGLLLKNGAASVLCSTYADGSGLSAAAARFLTNETAYILVCGSDSQTEQQAVLDVVLSASAQRREKICVFGMEDATKEQLIARAAVFNSQRAVLVGTDGSGVELAAAAAGAIAAIVDPAAPVVDISLVGVDGGGLYADDDYDDLILGGVAPIEGSNLSRGVTTKTTSNGGADSSFRELTTILIADEVIPGIRASLTAMFRRAKNTAKTREAIRTQVILELESRVEKEIIEQYGAVTAEADALDPTLCLVAFDFTVAHGLNRVHLSAIIAV